MSGGSGLFRFRKMARRLRPPRVVFVQSRVSNKFSHFRQKVTPEMIPSGHLRGPTSTAESLMPPEVLFRVGLDGAAQRVCVRLHERRAVDWRRRGAVGRGRRGRAALCEPQQMESERRARPLTSRALLGFLRVCLSVDVQLDSTRLLGEAVAIECRLYLALKRPLLRL